MLPLADLQHAFWAGITGPDEALAGALPTLDLIGEIRAHGALASADRLRIYARMYRTRLCDVLTEDYPRVAAVLGPDVFAAAVDGYVATHRSSHPSLRWFGQGFADRLAARADPGHPPFVADLARLEWARLAVFDAADAPVLDVAALRRIPAEHWPTLRLRFVPALETLHVAWPVHRIWEAAESNARMDWEPHDTWLRVWRQDDQVFQSSIDDVERMALRRAREGARFAELCADLTALVPEESVAAMAGALVLRWIEDGLLRGAELDP